jgi:biotin transport system substrate-specific component
MSSQPSQPELISKTTPRDSAFSTSGWLKISMMVSLITISAWIAIPFGSVPFTMQVVFVLMTPFILSTSAAMTAIALYLLMGAMGLPVFSGLSGGLHMLFGPTGGYLFGFLVAMPIMGMLAKKNMLFSLVIGLVIIYICGVSYLSFVANISFTNAIMAGFVPYVPLDILKILLVRLLLQKYKKIFTMECSLGEGAHE